MADEETAEPCKNELKHAEETVQEVATLSCMWCTRAKLQPNLCLMSTAKKARRDFGSFHSSNAEELIRLSEVDRLCTLVCIALCLSYAPINFTLGKDGIQANLKSNFPTLRQNCMSKSPPFCGFLH